MGPCFSRSCDACLVEAFLGLTVEEETGMFVIKWIDILLSIMTVVIFYLLPSSGSGYMRYRRLGSGYIRCKRQ